MELLEPILMFVLELFGEIFLEGLLELGLEGLQEAHRRQNRHPVVASLGYLLLGAAIGVLWVWLVPGRILRGRALPGASLVLGPLVAGGAMEIWGRARRASGKQTTNLATWYGGAAFALGIAIARFFGVR